MKRLRTAMFFLALCASVCVLGQHALVSFSKSQGEMKSLIKNGGFETATGALFSDWNPYAEGYSVAKSAGRNRSSALLCESDNGLRKLGGRQTINLNQSKALPITVSGWSRCENVIGNPNPDYSIYLDIQCVDGTWMWGQSRSFATGSADWNKVSYTIPSAKPIKTITVYCLFRNRPGKVWFDDIVVEQLAASQGATIFQAQSVQWPSQKHSQTSTMKIVTKNGLGMTLDGTSVASLAWGRRKLSCDGASGFLVRDAKQGTGYFGFSNVKSRNSALAAVCSDLALRLDARLQAESSFIRVSGKIADTSGKDRAVNLIFTIPVDASGWSWWDDVRRSRSIPTKGADQQGLEFINAMAIPCGSTGYASLYPIGAIAGPTDGLSLGIDMGKPAVFRVFYNPSARQLVISYDFGLIPDSLRSPGSAEFSFVLYRFDPKWGFRQAWYDYAQIYTDYFKVRSTQNGLWMPFGDISRIEGWQDFGFRYHEGLDNVPFDRANDILSFRYSQPSAWSMAMPPGTNRSVARVKAELERVAAEDTGTTGSMAKAVKNSVMYGISGDPGYTVEKTAWNDGVIWSMNPSPHIPGLPNDGSVIWNQQILDSDYTGVKNSRAGEYLDSLEGYYTTDLDYRREHMRYAVAPLSFDTQGNPVIFKGLAISELVSSMADDLHKSGKLLFANSVPIKFTYLCPWLDIMGIETNWLSDGQFKPDSDEQMSLRRSMSYGKPYLLLMNTQFNEFDTDMVEKYIKRCAFYGIMPGMFSHNASDQPYFNNPAWYNRDRHLFKKYIPLIKRISEAGWTPLTYARSAYSAVLLERYGQHYLTIMNDSSVSQTAKVTIDTARLGLRSAFTAKDLMNGREIMATASSFDVHLASGGVMLVDLKP
ncbi:MAG: hypothetical protein ACYC1M_00470 [Armatimonadota bacterium]